MTDRDMTIGGLKGRIMALCREKGWGVDGVQNPQHVAMAMTVEMAELLEHFQWLSEDRVDALMRGEDMERTAQIGEEFADVMMYGLQLMEVLGIDVTQQVLRKIEIVKLRDNGADALDEAH